MRRVLINTQNFLFGDAIAGSLQQGETEYEVMRTEKPDEIAEISKWYMPYVLLMEVTDCMPWLLSERLKIRGKVKEQNPQGKIVLIVDENAERDVAKQVCRAKKDGLIDQFVYGSVSSAYLSAVIDTL